MSPVPTAWEARRIQVLRRETAALVAHSTSRWADAHGFGERRSRAASFGEALQDLLPAPCGSGIHAAAAVFFRNVARRASGNGGKFRQT
jgi:hypothetical protein